MKKGKTKQIRASAAKASKNGKIKVKANLSAIALQGQVNLYHGYEEANVNLLLSNTFLDPYSGFPGFKQLRCRIEKAEVES